MAVRVVGSVTEGAEVDSTVGVGPGALWAGAEGARLGAPAAGADASFGAPVTRAPPDVVAGSLTVRELRVYRSAATMTAATTTTTMSPASSRTIREREPFGGCGL